MQFKKSTNSLESLRRQSKQIDKRGNLKIRDLDAGPSRYQARKENSSA
jgi:hypothetical protein